MPHAFTHSRNRRKEILTRPLFSRNLSLVTSAPTMMSFSNHRRVRARRDREESSRFGRTGHLTGDQVVNFGAMILVESKTFIHLRAGQAGKALRNGIHRLAVLQQSNHVMDSDSGVFNASMTTPNARVPNNVAISCADLCHAFKLVGYGRCRKSELEVRVWFNVPRTLRFRPGCVNHCG